jgi:electron transport complex protein RnfB
MTGLVNAVVSITAIGLIAGVMLVLAAKFMYVPEDPRIGLVLDELPGANCGACGYAGCSDYAKAIVENGATTNLCVPGGAPVAEKVSKLMGVKAEAADPVKAVVRCQGFTFNTKEKYDYHGVTTCAAASKIFAGPASCAYGCIGFGDCVEACKFDAIHVVNGVALVDMGKCTGCGACVTACPKDIIDLIPDDVNPVVLCRNTEKGAATRKVCSVGCISCMRCTKVCPTGAITVRDNLARIDQSICIACMQCVNDCPVKAIQLPNIRAGY